jgi:hypothetical protein
MRRLQRRCPLVESIETKVLLSLPGVGGQLGFSPSVHADLSKANGDVASEGLITGSARAFTLTSGIELVGGTAHARHLGPLRVSNGISAYMYVRGQQNAATVRIAVGFVDLEKPKSHQLVAVLTFEAPQSGTTYGDTNALDYVLNRWIPASQSGDPGHFGNVITAGAATLRFPHGVPTSGEAPVPFTIVLRSSD